MFAEAVSQCKLVRYLSISAQSKRFKTREKEKP